MKRIAGAAFACWLVLGGAAVAATAELAFDGVTFPDGLPGRIAALVETREEEHTVACDYHLARDVMYLGSYEGKAASKERGKVLDFCLDHYSERR